MEWKKVTIIFSILLIGLLVCPTLADPITHKEKAVDEIQSRQILSFPGGIGSVENSFLKITVNDEESNYASRFSLRTTGGDPANANDDNQLLLYGYDNPWSSFSTIRIDGIDYIYGISGCTYTEIPTVGPDYIRGTCLYDNIQVTQKLTLVQNPATGLDDIMEIRYIVKNTGQTTKSVGLREQLDTMLGGNDGAPFQVPGTGAVTTETEFLGASVPDYWLAFDDLSNPTVLSQGTLRGGDATPPDRIVFAAWPFIDSTYWDYPITPGRLVTSDSAVGLYWNPVPVAPNDEAEYVTYYGLSGFSGDATLSVSAPLYLSIVNCQYSPNPFTVTAFVQNTQLVPMSDVSTAIILPPGLALASGSATQVIGTLNPGEIGSVSWQVLAADQGADVSLDYVVTTDATGISQKTVTRSIRIPELQCTPAPEFPSVFLPVTLIIGFLGAVLLVQKSREQ